MSYKVTLRRLSDGLEKTIVDDLDWHDSSLYWWSEGNMGCDCNRASTFGDVDLSQDIEVECSTSKYLLIKIELSTGQVFDDLEDLNYLWPHIPGVD